MAFYPDIYHKIAGYLDFKTKLNLKSSSLYLYQIIKIYSIPKKYNKNLDNQVLKNFQHLRSLHISNLYCPSSLGLIHLRNLRSLYARGNVNINQAIPYLQELHALDISSNPHVTDDKLQQIHQLTTLYLRGRGVSYVTDGGIKHFKELRRLDIRWNYNITDKCLLYFPKLENLNPTECVTDKTISQLKNLKVLYASRCDSQITDKSISQLDNLEVLYTGANLNISDLSLINKDKIKLLCAHRECSSKFSDEVINGMSNLKVLIRHGHKTIRKIE